MSGIKTVAWEGDGVRKSYASAAAMNVLRCDLEEYADVLGHYLSKVGSGKCDPDSQVIYERVGGALRQGTLGLERTGILLDMGLLDDNGMLQEVLAKYDADLVEAICDYVLSENPVFDKDLSDEYRRQKKRGSRGFLSKGAREHYIRRGVLAEGVWLQQPVFADRKKPLTSTDVEKILSDLEARLVDYVTYIQDPKGTKAPAYEDRLSDILRGAVHAGQNEEITTLYEKYDLLNAQGRLIRRPSNRARVPEEKVEIPTRINRAGLYKMWLATAGRKSVVDAAPALKAKLPTALRNLHSKLGEELTASEEALMVKIGFPSPGSDPDFDISYVGILMGKCRPVLTISELEFLKGVSRHRKFINGEAQTAVDKSEVRTWVRDQKHAMLTGYLSLGRIKAHKELGNLERWGLVLTGSSVKGKERPEVVLQND